MRRADDKQLQLKLARECGLDIPRTLTANYPAAVRAVAALCREGMVVETLSSFAVYEEGEEKVMFTSRVSDEDLEHLDSLQYGPCTFQEKNPRLASCG